MMVTVLVRPQSYAHAMEYVVAINNKTPLTRQEMFDSVLTQLTNG
jgi:hypothetical protein